MSKKAYHHGNLEVELIEAGLKLLSEKGIEGFSLRKVAATCGVSHAAPYKHFKNIEELLNAMQLYVSENFASALQESLEIHKDSSDKMLYFAESYLEFFMKSPHYFHFFIKQDNVEIDLGNLESASKHKPFEVFRRAALEHLENANIPETMKNNILISMWGIVHGITVLAVMNNVKFEGDWGNLLKGILESLHYRKNNEKEG